MLVRTALGMVLLLVMAACGDDGSGPATAASSTSTTAAMEPSTSAPSTPTTTAATTTAPTTTTTTAATTTTLSLSPVMGLVVALGGGSEEVAVTWSYNPEPHVDHYDVYFAATPGGTLEFVRSIADDSLSPSPGSPGFVDHPRAQTVGMTCYRVRAIDVNGGEGPLSDESCFDPDPGPPSQVLDVQVGLGGGSGEVSVTWQANPEGDIASYDVHFSEAPGGPYAYIRSITDDSASPQPGRPGFIDFPRAQTVGMTCYRVQATDTDLNVGLLSVESCFQP